jgi:hypothetical protein
LLYAVLLFLFALELLSIGRELKFNGSEGGIEGVRADERDRSCSTSDRGGGRLRIGRVVSDLMLLNLLGGDLLAKRSEIEFALGQWGVDWVVSKDGQRVSSPLPRTGGARIISLQELHGASDRR